MSQSYKVFIRGSVLQFGNKTGTEAVFSRELTDPKPEEWDSILDELERWNVSILIDGKTTENWQNFCSHYRLIEAAGGLVSNENGDWLFIYRNDTWDLPKGKLEARESTEECAVREVAEECGIAKPTIVKPLSSTFHTYELKGERILKKTHWFLMESSNATILTPQTEEGVTEVKWVPTEKVLELSRESFGSIKDVIAQVIV